jgi:TonB-dependent receptor
MSRADRANRSRLVFLTSAAMMALATAAHAQDAAPKAADPAPASSVGAVKEVVITGQRAAIRNAIQTKKAADVILDSVSVDDAGKLPDNSVTEVLQRLPGVNITKIQAGTGVGSENFLAEGSNITIRGLDSTSTLNGRDSFSSVNGKNLAWEDIPPELMTGVDVVKSEAAYLPEGALGGVVDMRTAQPFDFKGLTLRASVGANYADYAGQAHPEGNLLVSDRWQTPLGEVGVLLNAAYSDLTTRADGAQVQPYFAQVWDPTLSLSALHSNVDGQRLPNLSDPGAQQVFEPFGVDFSQRQDDRTRTGLYGAVQWRPNDQLLLGLTVFDSQYKLDSIQHLLMVDDSSDTIVPVGATATFNKNGFLTSTNILQGYTYTQGGSLLAGATGGGTAGSWAYANNPYDFQSTYQSGSNETRDISLTANWRPNERLNVKFAYQHVESTATQNDHYAYDYAFLPPVGLTLSSYGSAALPKLTVPSGVDLTNPANFGYLATMDHMTDNRGSENAVYADGSYKLSDDGLFRTLRFGLKLTTRDENDKQTPYNYQGLSPYYNGGPYSYLSGAAGGAAYPQYNQLVNIGSWMNGQMGLPAQAYFPSMAELTTNFGTLHQQLGTGTNTVQGPVQFTPASSSSVRANTETLYVMGSFRDDTHFIWPFNGNIGVRIVNDEDKAAGNFLQSRSLGTSLVPITYNPPTYGPSATQFIWPQSSVASQGSHHGLYVLPSLNFQLLPVSQLHIRFAASETIQRPQFSQINPQGSLGASFQGSYQTNFMGSLQGDPNLKPERATQLDASVEWYFKSGGQVHAAVFWKSISDYIGTHSGSATYTIPATVNGGYLPASYPSPYGAASLTPCPVTPVTVGESCPQTVSYTTQSWFNENTAATIQGAEVGFTKYADFLPKPWSGFGIDANYTYIDSKQPGAVAYDMLGNKISNLPVTGLSKNTVNFTVMYDNGPLSMRLAYNWRDDFLVTTSAYQTSGSYINMSNVPDTTNAASVNQSGAMTYYALPVFSYPIATLDGTITYRLSSRVTWDLQGSNLTRETSRLYMGSGDERANRSWYVADRRYITRIHVAF